MAGTDIDPPVNVSHGTSLHMLGIFIFVVGVSLAGRRDGDGGGVMS